MFKRECHGQLIISINTLVTVFSHRPYMGLIGVQLKANMRTVNEFVTYYRIVVQLTAIFVI